ncbi:putative quinol monooxygenase [Catenovulum agarivorans]|uniref:putative quinol monooxygenase n=1 Tax=Catenovulum agarivorans TaxID=1172192 RepID=UPI0002DC3ED1|nr:antibiotic biosynthesis monooxygenase [Catenovulum agarivorans]
MPKIILQGFILIPKNQQSKISRLLQQHIQLTRAESGCLVFDVKQCPTNPLRYNVYEEFVDKKAFEQHQLRVKSSDWGKATTEVERHYQISELSLSNG